MNTISKTYRKILPWTLSGLVALGLFLVPHPSFAQGFADFRFRTEYFLNPDGSGKVNFEMCIREYDASGKPKIRSREEVLEQFERIKFIKLEAVKEGKIDAGSDGWGCASLTGYFPNLTDNLKGSQSNFHMHYGLRREWNGLRLVAEWPALNAYFHWYFGIPFKAMEKDAQEKGGPTRPGPDGTSKAMEKDEIEKWIENKRQEWARMTREGNSLYRALYGWRFEEVIHLPGRVESASNFIREGENTVRVLLGNWKLMAAVRVTHQEHVLREVVAAESHEPMRREAMKILFGADAPIEAVISGPLEPLFDYEMEVAAAKAAMPAMLERLGVERREP